MLTNNPKMVTHDKQHPRPAINGHHVLTPFPLTTSFAAAERTGNFYKSPDVAFEAGAGMRTHRATRKVTVVCAGRHLHPCMGMVALCDQQN